MGEITEFPIETVTWDEANITLPSGGGGSGASYFPIFCTDRLTPISLETVGDLDNIQDWMVPFSLTVSTIHASLSKPATTGTFTIDIRRNGVSVLSTLLTIDAGESNSTTAAVPAILSDFDWNMGDTITVAVTDDADGTASGLKLYITTGAVAADTESPTAPTGLSASVISSTQIDLTCDAASDNVGVVGYQFQRATNSGFSSGVVSAALQTSPAVSFTGLTPSTTYYFRVRAKDAAGNYSDWSSSANETTPGFTDIDLVVSTSKGATNPLTDTTSSIDTTGASLLVVAVSFYPGGGAGIPVVTDSKGNTWTALTQRQSPSGNNAVRIFYAANPAVGSGHTFTVASQDGVTNLYHSIFAAAFSDVKTTSPADQENGAGSSSASSLATGSVTPTENNELLIAVMSSDQATESIDLSFIEAESQAFLFGSYVQGALAYKVQSTAAAQNPTWTITGASHIAVAIATFKHN